MASHHTCSQCESITRTSPGQVFLKCKFWCRTCTSDASVYVPDEWQDNLQAYIALHCHVQPESEACPAFRPRRADEAAIDTRPLLRTA